MERKIVQMLHSCHMYQGKPEQARSCRIGAEVNRAMSVAGECREEPAGSEAGQALPAAVAQGDACPAWVHRANAVLPSSSINPVDTKFLRQAGHTQKKSALPEWQSA